MEQKEVRDPNSCPDCNDAMDNGYVVGSNVLWWTNKEPNFAITKKGGNIQLARKIWGWAWARTKAKRCGKCNLIIIRH